MIALLTGVIAQKDTNTVIIDVAGVGYRVQVPLSTFYDLPEQGKVRLHIHTHVKEDAISLYGFSSNDEKEFFALLLSVSGVGPKLAITILSHMPAAELALSLAEGDINRLVSIPGIGKKSAERLVLELQDKASSFSIAHTTAGTSSRKSTHPDLHDDVISALVNLGYKENIAKTAVKGLNLSEESTLEESLKQALQRLRK